MPLIESSPLTSLVVRSENESEGSANKISIHLNNEHSKTVYDDDDQNNAQDEDIEDDHNPISDEERTPVITIDKQLPAFNPMRNATTIESDSKPHPLLQEDITDLFSIVPREFLAGLSFEPQDEHPCFSSITFQFFTDYIETETACQWQICNKTLLTCEILVHNKHYLDGTVVVECVYQTCECHPANASKVPFIDRLVRNYFEKVQINMEQLKLARAAFNPVLREKYFLELVSNVDKRKQYEDMLVAVNDNSILDELIDYEILDSERKIAKKLQLLKMPRTNTSGSNAHYSIDENRLPKLNSGYLVQFCEYFQYRMRNLNSLCVMCGTRTFDLSDKKALKPTICEDYKCFSNAMDSKFRDDPLPPSIFSIEVADFLLLLVYAAIHSSRHQLVLDPYPKLINPYNTSTTLIDQDGNKQTNIVELKQLINDLMTIGSITQYEAAKISLRSMIELKHPWGFSFFHWLMGTNRYHFSLIPEAYQIASIGTKHQYFIKHEDIEKQIHFKKLRAENGSIFAFHGSPQENWHSILRSGLQIGKGGYLLHGAAYGAGIYVSPSFQFASSYSRNRGSSFTYESSNYAHDYSEKTTPSPLNKRNWSCIALCEIIDLPSAYRKHTQDIWTIQDPNLICTRFIFFYGSCVPHITLQIDSEPIVAPIRKLIHTLNTIAC